MQSVVLDSYRVEKRATIQIILEDEDAPIDPVPVQTDVHIHVPDMDTLSNIIQTFMQLLGNIDWKEADRIIIERQILEMPNMVAETPAFKNAMSKPGGEQESRLESDLATESAIFRHMDANAQLYQVYNENEAFRNMFNAWIFNIIYRPKNGDSNGDKK